MQKDKINKVLTILLPVQIGIVFFLSNYPTFIERFYTNGVYPFISMFLRLIFWIHTFFYRGFDLYPSYSSNSEKYYFNFQKKIQKY